MNAAMQAGRSLALGIGLGVGLATAVSSQPASGEIRPEAFPPVEHASFHQLVFADADVAILSNRYPPSGDSGFHAHYRDLFAVTIQPAEFWGQGLGRPLTRVPASSIGEALYSPAGPGGRAHRIVNGDKGPQHIMVVELRRPAPRGDAVSTRTGASGYVQLVDNVRLRAWRLVLEPGQSTTAITQGGDGVRIVVRGGLLTTSTPGVPDQTLALRPADFAIQKRGGVRALRNSGAETIELVELELK